MELAKKPAIALFFGFIIGLVLWVYSLVYIEDKPVPNAVFTQSIIDTKIQAARDLRESTKVVFVGGSNVLFGVCLLYTSPSPRDQRGSRMPSSA